MLAFLLMRVNSSYFQQDRANRLLQGSGDILIGITTSAGKGYFLEGIRFALDEINGKGGIRVGTQQRKLQIWVQEDQRSKDKGREVSQRFAQNQDVMAVIGHLNSGSAISASLIYNKAKILFITPGATNPLLTLHNLPYLIRSIPSDLDFGRQIARLGYRHAMKRIVIIFDRSTRYGKGLADIIAAQSDKIGIQIVSIRSYLLPNESKQKDLQTQELTQILNSIIDLNFDAIVFAGGVHQAAALILQARKMGIQAKFIGGDSLDSPLLAQIAGQAAEGTIVPSVFNSDSQGRKQQQFNQKFFLTYGFLPDTWAVQGYDALKLLAHGIEKQGDTTPLGVAHRLRQLKHWPGIAGFYSFNQRGDLVGRKIFFKHLRNGIFSAFSSD